MDIFLPAEFEAFVIQKISSGLYQTPSEVIQEGLRLLRDREALDPQKLEELRKEIAIGLQQADEGRVTPLNANESLARIRRERAAPQGDQS